MACTIVLDNDDYEYLSGSVVEGKVVFRFIASETVEDIVVELIGQEETNWLETVQNGDQNKNLDYKGSNVFLTIEKTLSEGGDLEAGTHEFPFKFDLPKKIPGTYACETGLVKFFIKATAGTLLPFSYWIVKEITVKSPIYIEELDEKWLVSHYETAERTNSSLWCIASGPTTIDMFMSKRAFAQGELVNVKVDVTNMSEDNIWRVDLYIGQTIKSKSRVPKVDSRTEDVVLVYEKLEGVDAYSQRSYEFLARIPRLGVIPNFSLCQLFSQHCYIQVVAVSKSYNLKVSTYIIIGEHHPNATVLNNHPIGTIGEQEAYNPRPTASSTTTSRFRSPSRQPTSILDESYPLIDDVEDPPPSYDVVCQEATKKKQTRIVEAVAEVVPSAPPQALPTAPPPMQVSVPYPSTPLSNPSVYPPEDRRNVAPYPTGDPLAEWTRNRSLTGDTTASVSTAAQPGDNVASGGGTQSDEALYPPPMGSVKPSDIAQQAPVSFTPMPMPPNKLYLPPMSNMAPYPTVSSSSSSFTSMPVPTRGLYPPEQQKEVAPYPTEDPLSKWNQIKSAVTDVTYSTISFPSVPKESPTVSDDEVEPTKEMVAELSDLPIPSKHKQSQREPVDVPHSEHKDSENEVASDSETQPEPAVSSTSNPSNPMLDDSLCPTTTDAVKHPVDSSNSPLPSAMPMPSKGLYPPPQRSAGLPYPVPREDLTDSDENVTREDITQSESSIPNRIPEDSLYPPPMDAVKPPIDFPGTPSVSGPYTRMPMPGDGIYPSSKGSDSASYSAAKEISADADEEPSVSSASNTVQNDGLYPPPMDTIQPPTSSVCVSDLTDSNEEVASNSDIQLVSTSNPDGLYPPPMDAVKPPVGSSIAPSTSSVGMLSSDGLYPPPKESVAPGSSGITSIPEDCLYPPPMGAAKPYVSSSSWNRMPVPGDESYPTSDEAFRPVGFVTSYTAASMIAGLVPYPKESAIGFGGLEDRSSSSTSSKDATKVPSTDANE